MTHLDDFVELAHQTKQEEIVIIDKLTIAGKETVLCKLAHGGGVVFLSKSHKLAHCGV